MALGHYPADDAPPYIAISLVSFLIVPMAFYTGYSWNLPNYLQLLIWIPVTLVLVLLTLPSIKGAVIGVLWLLGIQNEESVD